MTGSRSRVTAALFDMDGLLVDSERIWQRVETEVFEELGADITPVLRSGTTVGMRVDDAMSYLLSTFSIRDVDAHKLGARVVERVVEAIRADAVLLPGVERALAFFESEHVALGLASGSTPPVIDAALETTGLAGRFATVCSAIDDQHGKPHPSIFLRAAELLGSLPERCVVLEDSLNGCIAAKAARMRVIAVPHANDADDPRYAIADVRLSSLEQIDSETVRAVLGLTRATSEPTP